MSLLSEKLKILKEESELLKIEIEKKIVAYIGAGLGLIASFAWNDAIRSMIQYLYPIDKDTVLAKIIYAAIVTIITVLVTIYLVRLIRVCRQAGLLPTCLCRQAGISKFWLNFPKIILA